MWNSYHFISVINKSIANCADWVEWRTDTIKFFFFGFRQTDSAEIGYDSAVIYKNVNWSYLQQKIPFALTELEHISSLHGNNRRVEFKFWNNLIRRNSKGDNTNWGIPHSESFQNRSEKLSKQEADTVDDESCEDRARMRTVSERSTQIEAMREARVVVNAEWESVPKS